MKMHNDIKVNQIWKYKHPVYSLNNGYVILVDISDKTSNKLDYKKVSYKFLEKNSRVSSTSLNLFLQDFDHVQ